MGTRSSSKLHFWPDVGLNQVRSPANQIDAALQPDSQLTLGGHARRAGLAVRMLPQAGITVALLSGGRGGASEQRVRHLDIHHCRVGVSNKCAGLEQLLQELAMGREQTACLGDNLTDLPGRAATGLLITPADAAPGQSRQTDWILRRRGGSGALREFSDAPLDSQGWMRELETSELGTTN